ncbi:hypothetical protein CEXT_324811 [Caerostris extrusa]|uniref:Uncharacterized protein n=1 Tax=Caerostris extrusa TaxID=172846 RepID=A0AAV4WGT0_CAEEX|nr:hypothetical protein CEXT_324811 [Caerostris extrusa]
MIGVFSVPFPREREFVANVHPSRRANLCHPQCVGGFWNGRQAASESLGEKYLGSYYFSPSLLSSFPREDFLEGRRNN